MRESTVEQHLVARVKALGGEVRKVKWINRPGAPDRLVMLPPQHVGAPGLAPSVQVRARTLWVELKNPKTILTFPANPHERAQAREHDRMRALGQVVLVIGTKEAVNALIN